MKSYHLFFRLMITSSFRSSDRLIINDLFNKFTYRVPANLETSWLSILVYMRLTFFLIWSEKKQWRNTLDDKVVCDFNQVYENDLKGYLDSVGYVFNGFIFRDSLTNGYHFLSRIVLMFYTLLVILVLLPKFILTKHRGRIAIIPLELLETQLFYKNLSLAKEIIIFSPYEKDIPFISNLLMKNGVRVILIPSCNPIRFFYKHVVCDVFVFTAPFQKNDIEQIRKEWDVKEFWFWKPFDWYKIPLYDNTKPVFDIGIISSASHLRRSMNLANHMAETDYLAEEKMLKALAVIVNELKLSLIIYLHPKEKVNLTTANESAEYYKNIFGSSVAILDRGLKTADNFKLCNVAISGFSTAQIERLFAGYKSIFTPMGILENYFNDSRLDAISANTEEELRLLIVKTLSLATEEYFKRYNLLTFRYKNYHE